MLCVLSPAKKLDLDPIELPIETTEPAFLNQAAALIKQLKSCSVTDIRQLMGLSEKLSELNVDRYQRWKKKPAIDQVKAAAFMFKGDVYQGLDIESLSKTQLAFAQKTLCILSGLYGVLKPLDAIQPYRLEMGTKLATPKGKNLYDFWGCQVTDALNAQLSLQKKPTLINLASQEYFGVLQPKALVAPVITPIFKDEKNGAFKIISFYAKKARGLMAKFIVENKITRPEDLKAFDYEGYGFEPKASNDAKWVFHRAEKP